MKQDYLQNMLDVRKLCLELRSIVEKNYYKKDGSLTVMGRDGYFCFYPLYRQHFDPIKGVLAICDLFGIECLEEDKPIIDAWIHYLENPQNLSWKITRFESAIKPIEKLFEKAETKIHRKISLLDSEERNRLNESIHCFLERCFYSAIAMAVSAIEFRLFSLMTAVKPDPKLKELTLGQLIKEYLQNKEKYDNIIPKKHEPLLEHCNIYRVFSVHPKKERINKPVASSIISMTFMFLLDEKSKSKIV